MAMDKILIADVQTPAREWLDTELVVRWPDGSEGTATVRMLEPESQATVMAMVLRASLLECRDATYRRMGERLRLRADANVVRGREQP